MSSVIDQPIQPGSSAPHFELPAVQQEGVVGLHDYHGKPLLLALFRGVY